MILLFKFSRLLPPFFRRRLPAIVWLFFLAANIRTAAAEVVPPESSTNIKTQAWNWHVQSTDIVQGDPGFHAKYSGPNSLNSGGEVQETVTLDLYAGARLWRGAEAHLDFLMWQGFGLTHTFGIEGFPNGDTYKA